MSKKITYEVMQQAFLKTQQLVFQINIFLWIALKDSKIILMIQTWIIIMLLKFSRKLTLSDTDVYNLKQHHPVWWSILSNLIQYNFWPQLQLQKGQNLSISQVWWRMPVNLSTWETETGGWQVQGQAQQHSESNLGSPEQPRETLFPNKNF